MDNNIFVPASTNLDLSGIEFCDFELGAQKGFLFDKDNFTRMCELNDLQPGEDQSTSTNGVVTVELTSVVSGERAITEDRKKIFQVEQHSSYDDWKKLEEMVMDWLYKTNVIQETTEVYFIKSSKGSEVPMDGKLRLYFGHLAWDDLPGTIKEIKSGPLTARVVLGEKIIRICGLDKHYPDQNARVVALSLLEKALPIALAKGKELKNLEQEVRNETYQRSHEQYIKECLKRFEKTLKGTRDGIQKGNSEIEHLQQLLVKTIRETKGKERKLKQLETAQPAEEERYAQEFVSLMETPGVEDVQVKDGVISVFTYHIYIKCEGETYDIGKFRMDIYTSGTNGGIRFHNLTHKGPDSGHSGYNIIHPHVNESGKPCLGNIQETVAQLIAEYEYSALAQIGIQYLESVNTNDEAGKGIYSWPKKGEKIEEKK